MHAHLLLLLQEQEPIDRSLRPTDLKLIADLSLDPDRFDPVVRVL